MRSIRLSLMVYFLGLLALALGAASVLAYQIANQTLMSKKVATEELITTQFRERCRKEEARLDEELRSQAQTMARWVNFHLDWHRFQYQRLHVLGLLTSHLSPNGYLLTPAWLFQGVRSPLYFEISHRNLPKIRINEDELRTHLDDQAPEFFQIDSAWGSSYRSRSLGLRVLPLNIQMFAPKQVLHASFEDIRLDPELEVRRVILKTPSARSIRFPHPPPWGSGRPEPVGSPGNRLDSVARPSIFIQCAFDVSKREQILAGFQEGRDRELASLDAETQASLLGLRNRLLAIASITFALTALGTLWLVNLGLTPLRRLSEAVSKVSPRDFRLPLEEKKLPRELQPIEQRLVDTLNMLKRAFAREKQATADLSHELRTPLSALLTTTEIALRKPRSTEEYRELLEDCRLSAQQMNQVIERLLTLARLDAGVELLKPQAVDASQLAQQCANLMRPLVEARGLTLRYHRNGPLPLTADPDKLREVLTNLLHNAIQYNRPNGRIDLHLTREQDQLCIEVQDNGIGIAPEQREHIFERFYRGDPSRGADGLHAGLGLSIVKEYVDLMKGSIGVDSAEGQGCTFRIRLPIR